VPARSVGPVRDRQRVVGVAGDVLTFAPTRSVGFARARERARGRVGALARRKWPPGVDGVSRPPVVGDDGDRSRPAAMMAIGSGAGERYPPPLRGGGGG
jgi:hypothetical protein